MDLGSKILELRKKQNLSQEKLGEKSGLQDKLFQTGN